MLNMMMKYHILYLISFLLLVSPTSSGAQCGDVSGLIKDTTITYFPIHVSNAINNDLLNEDQGVCQISIYFKHTRVRDLEMFLRSPNGTLIQLVGQAIVGLNTAFTKWNISFLPETVPVLPDAGFLENWNNAQDWTGFNNYSGSYYPYDGSLKEFDSGTVNGDWVLIVKDFYVFDTGKIIEFSIEFCDNTNISCESCLPNAGMIAIEKDTLCFGEPISDSYINVDFDQDVPDSSFYGYSYLIISKDTIVSVNSNLDFSNLEAGLYSICGFSYSLLNSVNSIIGIEKDSLLNLLSNGQICGELSMNCLDVLIKDISDAQIIDEQLCSGEVLVFEGVSYDTTGQFYIQGSSNLCEDLTILNIDLFNNEDEIYSIGNNVLSCSVPIVLLSVTNINEFEDYNFEWYTNNGYFNSPTSFVETVEVNKAGTYYFVWDNGECYDTISYKVEEEEELANVEIGYDYTTCDSIKVYYNSTKELVQFTWTLPDGTMYNNVDFFYLEQTGIVTLNARDEDDCIHKINLEILPFSFGSFNIQLDTLDCMTDTVNVGISNTDINYQYSWYNSTGDKVSDSSSFLTDIVGDYYLLVENSFCEFYDTVSIVELGEFPVLEFFEIDSLSCNIDSVDIFTTYDQSGLLYNWTGPFGYNSLEEIPKVWNPGTYFVTVINDDLCMSIDSVVVIAQEDKPRVIIGTNVLNCDMDSLKVDITILAFNPSYIWTGPNGFTSDVELPFVYEKGVYQLLVNDENNCQVYVEVTVDGEMSAFEVGLSTDTISCINAKVKIDVSIDDDDIAMVDWIGPDGFIATSSNLEDIMTSGWYNVTIVDTRGCYLYDSIEVFSNNDFPIAKAGSDTLFNCIMDPISLVADHSVLNDNTTINWSSSNTSEIKLSNSLNPIVIEEGDYYLELIDEKSGCSSIDTISVMELDELFLDIGNDSLVVPGAEILSTIVTNIDLDNIEEIIWSSNTSLPCSSCLDLEFPIIENTSLTLTLIDSVGCSVSATKIISIIEADGIYIPNVFSVNNRIDQEFRLSYMPHVKHVLDATIYSNWGEQMYRRTNFNPSPNSFVWNGVFRGELVNPSVFVVVVNYELINGDRKSQIGTTTILR